MTEQELEYAVRVNDKDLRDLVKRIDAVNIGLGPDTKKAVEVADDAIRVHARTIVKQKALQRELAQETLAQYKAIASEAKRGSSTQIAASIEAAKQARRLGLDVKGVGVQYDHLGRSVKGFEHDLGGATRGVLAGSGALGHLTRNLAYASTFFIGAGSITAAVRASWEELRNFDEAQTLVRTTLKSTGDVAGVTAQQIDAYSAAEARKTTFDKATVESAENQLLKFTEVRNELGKGNDIFNQASQAALDLAQHTGRDATTAALQLGKALNDPIRGLTALRRIGVTFTQQQSDQIKTLTQSGHILEAQKLIIGQVEKAYGGAADAAGRELGGQMKILKHDAEEVGAAFLHDLQPQIQGAVTDLRHWLDTTVNTAEGQRNLKHDAHELADGIKTLASGIKTVVGDANDVAKAFGGWKTVLEEIVAIKLSAWMLGVSRSLATLIGTEAAAGSGALIGGEVSGLAGAGAASGLLLSNLQALAAIGTIVVTMKLIRDWQNAGNQKDVSRAAADSSGGRIDLGKLRQDIGGKIFGGGAAGEIYFDPSTGKFDAAGAIGTMNGAEVFDKTLTAAQAAKVLGISVRKLMQLVSGVDVPANTPGPNGFTKSQVMGAASAYSSTPYQWGGGHGAIAGPSFASGHGRAGVGLDCSGYARAVLSNLGITVNGDAAALLGSAKSHPSVMQLQPGDLVFYEGVHPNHVMVYIGNGQVIGETHTGAGGPEVKPVNYLKITGTGRYTATEQTSGTSGSTKPRTTPHGNDFGTAAKLTQVPGALRYALALAEGTSGKGDDQTATRNIISFLRGQLGKTSSLGTKADILDEINSYTNSLAGLSGKKKSKYASGAQVASFGDTLKSELAELAAIAAAGFDGVAAKARPKVLALQKLLGSPISPKELALAKVHLKELEKAYDLHGLGGIAKDVSSGRAQGSALAGVLGRLPADLKIPVEDAWGEVIKTISPAELKSQVQQALSALAGATNSSQAKKALAALKQLGQLATQAVSIDKDGVVKAAQDAIDAANTVLSNAKSSFQSAWSAMSSKALSAFDQETQDALARLKVLVHGPGGDFLYGSGDLTPSQQLAKQLQDQADAASKAKAYTQAQSDLASKKARVAQLVAAGFSENTNALRQARQDQADAQDSFDQLDLQKRVDALNAQGDIEQKTAETQLATAQKNYESERALQRDHLQQMLGDLEKALEDGKISVEDARTKLGKVWDAIGLDAGAAGAAMGDAFVTSLNESLNDPSIGIWPTLDAVSKAIADLKNLKDIQDRTVPPSGGATTTRGGGRSALALADGAYVRARRGGVAAIVGEGRDDEIVSPVPMLRRVVRDELGRTQAAGATLHIENYHAYDGTDEQLLVGKLSLLMQSRPRP